MESIPSPEKQIAEAKNLTHGSSQIGQHDTTNQSLEEQVQVLSSLIKDSKNLTIITGLDVSCQPNQTPSLSIMSMKALQESKILKQVITSNIDNQHKKSGIPSNQVIEMFGNICAFKCSHCGHLVEEPFEMVDSGKCILNQKCYSTEGCQGFYQKTVVDDVKDIDKKTFNNAILAAMGTDLLLLVGADAT